MCPVTQQVKGYPFEVLIPDGSGVEGAILADQIKSLDWRVRQAEFLVHLAAEVVSEVVDKVQMLIESDV